MSQILRSNKTNRGYVYQCCHCNTGKPYQSERRLVASHIYKEHVVLGNAPFYCTLCLFRCTDEETLVRHVQPGVYPAHGQKAELLVRVGGIVDDAVYLMRSTDPYHLADGRDFVRLTASDQTASGERGVKWSRSWVCLSGVHCLYTSTPQRRAYPCHPRDGQLG